MRTREECIDLFTSSGSNHFDRVNACEGLESLSEWYLAAHYWKVIDRISDSEACMLIADATAKGNEYRRLCEPLNKWVEDVVNRRMMSLAEIYPKQIEIYNSIYKKD